MWALNRNSYLNIFLFHLLMVYFINATNSILQNTRHQYVSNIISTLITVIIGYDTFISLILNRPLISLMNRYDIQDSVNCFIYEINDFLYDGNIAIRCGRLHMVEYRKVAFTYSFCCFWYRCFNFFVFGLRLYLCFFQFSLIYGQIIRTIPLYIHTKHF